MAFYGIKRVRYIVFFFFLAVAEEVVGVVVLRVGVVSRVEGRRVCVRCVVE